MRNVLLNYSLISLLLWQFSTTYTNVKGGLYNTPDNARTHASMTKYLLIGLL